MPTANALSNTLRTLALSLTLVLSSCTGPQPRPIQPENVSVPRAWSAGPSAQGAVRTNWWRDFGSRELDAVVLEALAANHDLKQAAARVDAAAVMARIAGAEMLPTVRAGGSASRQKSTVAGRSVTSNRYDAWLELSWEVDLWGRLRAHRRAAADDRAASEADLNAARESIAAQAVKGWFAAAEGRLQHRLAATTVATYRDSLTIAERRFSRGLASSLEVRLASSNLAAAEALLERRVVQLDRATRQLELLMGRYPSGALKIPAHLPTLPPPVPAGLPSELLHRRPDIVAARLRVLAADERVVESRAELFPRLSLTAVGGTASDALKDLLEGDAAVWSLLGNLVQPVFEGGRLLANVELKEARTSEAVAAFAKATLGAFGEVESALAAEEHLRAREAKLRKAAEHASAAAQLAQNRYRSGLQDLFAVLEAQRRQLAANGELLAVRRERLHNRANLHLALGGSFD